MGVRAVHGGRRVHRATDARQESRCMIAMAVPNVDA
ncbi:hypothetical protein CGCFRS4_v015934 [Colletotrichum fructicola]|nr:hypothetical protein CGCFRS4_v015934 [Colletotrichum fructicola]